MKNSIKRAQSQACLGFAEQKNFRPLAKLKKLSLTLALLITAATGAWASGEIVVTVTAADLQADLSNPFTKNGVTIKCSDRMTGGLAFNELNEMSTTLGYFTKIEITNQFSEGISGINGINGFSVNGSVATWTGKASSVGLGHYSVGPVVQFVFTIEPAGIDVTYNDAHTEASFTMPQYDVTATYTLKRDMTVDVDGEMADRIRIQMVDNAFQAVDATQMNPVVKDNHETNSPVTLTETTDYTLQLQKQSETNADEWTDATALSVGNFRYKITGAGNYSGICYSEEFALFEGYEIKVAAGEYATFYKDEPLYADTETSADAVLYTITSVSADKAVLSSAITTAPSLTPLLVFNSSEETKTFLLIPADAEPNLALTVAPEFKGTLEATTIAASTDEQNNYALNGKAFVFVKNAIEVGPNKAWLSVNTGVPSARITLVFDDETTKIANTNITNITNGNWYDLNGRKLDKMPTKKGVYLFNGRKVVVK